MEEAISSVTQSAYQSGEVTWKDLLSHERGLSYFKEIITFIEKERQSGKVVYPPNEAIFNALKYTPFNEVKVVILGQDPYHGPNQAHGLSFSVQPGIPFPPSLRNIFEELKNDMGVSVPKSGSLKGWAEQGVLLLNAVLSVEAGKPESHSGIGWQRFTDKVIQLVNEYKDHVVFILWGAHAQKKIELIDASKHVIIKSPHPSPFSAHRGFLGSRPFSRANEALRAMGKDEINWANLTDM